LYSINNISIKEYFSLKDSTKYDIFIDAIKPKNIFNGKKCNFNSLTFDEIKVMKDIFRNPTFENIQELIIELYRLGSFELSAIDEYMNASIFDLFAVKNYLQEFLINIINRENKVLSGSPDEKMIALNAQKRLEPVNHMLTKIRLAEQFGKAPHEIGSWKYNRVFSILVANKISNDIQLEYQKMK
jgi:hypothetical protein